jgi:DNA topoisomerase-2
VKQLVPKDDFDCLVYRDDDGILVEPEWYAPILPMILINGSRGIGTGYSTFIPSFNPNDLKDAITEWLEKGTGLDREFAPWTRGFKGKITKIDKQDYLVEGVWKTDGDTTTITELPVETWTQDFRESLDKMCVEGIIKDYTDTSTDTDVLVKVKGDVTKLLTQKIKLTNMHAFDSRGIIKKYDTPNDILREYVGVRLELYEKRRSYMLNALREKLPYHENVVRFIKQQCLETPLPDLRRQTLEKCDELLEKQKFAKIKDSFDYLMDLPIKSLTLKNAQKHENDLEALKQDIKDLESQTSKGMWLRELKALKI